MYIIYEGETDPHNILYEGDWSNGMIGVSKTFGGSSILSSPARRKAGMLEKSGVPVFFVLPGNEKKQQRNKDVIQVEFCDCEWYDYFKYISEHSKEKIIYENRSNL